MNSKTHLIKTTPSDPFSTGWFDVQQVTEFKEDSSLDILGVGYTVYPGSENEHAMIHQAVQIVCNAHRHGLITILWNPPGQGRSKMRKTHPRLTAGAAGLAAVLGGDFVKVNYPKKDGVEPADALKEAVVAAGRTKVVCAGEEHCDVKTVLQRLYDQIHLGGAAGNATGRNIHQKPPSEAVKFCNAIYAITIENAGVEDAWNACFGD